MAGWVQAGAFAFAAIVVLVAEEMWWNRQTREQQTARLQWRRYAYYLFALLVLASVGSATGFMGVPPWARARWR